MLRSHLIMGDVVASFGGYSIGKATQRACLRQSCNRVVFRLVVWSSLTVPLTKSKNGRSAQSVHGMSLATRAAAFRAVGAGRQAGDDHVAFVNSAQHIITEIEFVLTRDRLMPLN